MTETRPVHSGFRSRKRQEWVDVFIQESLRDQLRTMAVRYAKLRAAVQNWAKSRGLENEGNHLHEMLREVGRWPERDERTDDERAVDEVRFVGAHRRMRGR